MRAEAVLNINRRNALPDRRGTGIQCGTLNGHLEVATVLSRQRCDHC